MGVPSSFIIWAATSFSVRPARLRPVLMMSPAVIASFSLTLSLTSSVRDGPLMRQARTESLIAPSERQPGCRRAPNASVPVRRAT